MNKQHICWLAFERPDLASYRFRIAHPYCLIQSEDRDIKCTLMNPKFMQGTNQFIKADTYVYHKHVDPDFEYHQAHWIKNVFAPEAKLVFDVCDDHFDRELGPHYKRMCELADVVTTTNERFAERIFDVTAKKAFVCFDPVNSEAGEFKGTLSPKTVWFGHITNLSYFQKEIFNLSSLKEIYIYTNQERMDCWETLADKRLRYKKFIPGRVEAELKNYDVAILPQDDSKNETKYKSPNRVVDALNAGLAVVTNSEEVYGEFKDFIYLDKSLETAYKSYLDDPDTAAKVKAGQDYINNNYNNKIIKQQWKRALINNG